MLPRSEQFGQEPRGLTVPTIRGSLEPTKGALRIPVGPFAQEDHEA
jgi:hypothetical protein